MKPVYDAVVIGSGFGGAVAACRLSQAGLSVLLLERGRAYPPGSFPRNFANLGAGWLFAREQGLFDIKPINDVMIFQAAGLGGGSLIYANVHMRPPPEVFEQGWPAGYSREALDPYFDLAAYMLDVSPITSSARGVPTKTLRMRAAAERLGREAQWFQPNLAVNFVDVDDGSVINKFGSPQKACTHCGECIIGCNIHAKNTLDLNYIAIAKSHGCDVATQTEAKLIRRSALGYRVEYRQHVLATDGAVDARWVFVCAGAVNTSELLLRCRDQYRTLPLLGEALGRRYSANGDYLAFARDLREPFNPSEGPSITSALLYDGPGPSERLWFLLEDGGFPQQLAELTRVLELSPEISSRTRRGVGFPFVLDGLVDALDPRGGAASDRAAFFMMGRDQGDGRVRLLPFSRELYVEWNTGEHLPLYDTQGALVSDVARALGGHAVANPFWQWLKLPMTVHNLGGCLMADDPANGVVDAHCESFAYPGLFVIDGSVLPSATGANPSATILAVAERSIEHFVRTRLDRPDWQAPEVVSRSSIVEPLSRTRVPPGGAAPPTHEGLGVNLREELHGYFEQTTTRAGIWMSATLTVSMHDLPSLLSTQSLSAQVTGVLIVTGLTDAHGTRVSGGSVRFTLEAGMGLACAYRLPFHDATGKGFVLEVSRSTVRVRGVQHSPASIWSVHGERTCYATGSVPAISLATIISELVRARWTGAANLTEWAPWVIRLALRARQTGLQRTPNVRAPRELMTTAQPGPGVR